MTNSIAKPPQSKSTPKLAVVPKSQSKALRLEGHTPSAEMPPGKYLAQCESAWLEPISRGSATYRPSGDLVRRENRRHNKKRACLAAS